MKNRIEIFNIKIGLMGTNKCLGQMGKKGSDRKHFKHTLQMLFSKIQKKKIVK